MRRPFLQILCVLMVAVPFIAVEVGAQTSAPADAPYKAARAPVDKRVADLLSRMTLEEKATMLSGSGWMESTAVERLGRSEEHTSELQSLRHLVCRLLLE